MNRFTDKVALITGGASGLGQAIALRLASEGAKVVIADMNDDAAEQTRAMIEEAGGEAVTIHMDVSKPEDNEAGVTLAIETWGKLNIAVNNAGIGASPGMTGDRKSVV